MTATVVYNTDTVIDVEEFHKYSAAQCNEVHMAQVIIFIIVIRYIRRVESIKLNVTHGLLQNEPHTFLDGLY